MALPVKVPAKVVCLRGNHEDAWLRVLRDSWDDFSLTPKHGCFSMLRSFAGGAVPSEGEQPTRDEAKLLRTGEFIPPEVVAWMGKLKFWHEDSHGIYVHAGLLRGASEFMHPRDMETQSVLAWIQTRDFVLNYKGKNVFFGHTPTGLLPQNLSLYTPQNSTDIFETEDTFGLDTGCGNGGFLTAIELPAMVVYESR